MKSVTELATEAGFEHYDQFPADYQNKIQKFAALLDAPCEPAKLWCETCEGKGTVDNTLGGNNINATDHDPCPDCDGSGGFISSVYRTTPPAEKREAPCNNCAHCEKGTGGLHSFDADVCRECSHYWDSKYKAA